MRPAVVLWDFDGTLAWRDGLWSGCVLEVLDEMEPGHSGTLETTRHALRGGFPWHRHSEPHPELCLSDDWWSSLAPMFLRAIEGAGVERSRAGEMVPAVRARFTDHTRGWHAFDDSRSALATMASAGWRNVILSNHVPELEELVTRLDLGDTVEHVFSSALTGYEKPHPEAFRHALAACGAPSRRWMVGDNSIADVQGAEAIGIPAVLIRRPGQARHSAPDAAGAARLITSE